MYQTFKDILDTEILKYNPYHDKKGRFCGPGSASFMTITTRDSQKQHLADDAVSRAKEAYAREHSQIFQLSDIVSGDWETLKKYAREQMGIEVSDDVSTKLDFELTRSSMEGIEGVQKLYPQIAGEIRTVDTAVDQMTVDAFYGSGRICFNERKYGKDREKVRQDYYDELVRSYGKTVAGWVMPEKLVDDPEWTGAHEAGHCVVDHLVRKVYELSSEQVERCIRSGSYTPDVLSYVYDWNNATTAGKVVSDAVASAKNSPASIGADRKRKTGKELKQEISDYADNPKNPDETIAEAIADIQVNGNDAKLLSRMIDYHLRSQVGRK